GHLDGYGINHQDTGTTYLFAHDDNEDLEGGVLDLLEGGVRDPPALDVRQAHGADRPFEGDAREHQGGGGAVDRHDVGLVGLVDGHDRGDDVHLVAEPVRETRAQGPVDETGGEDG